LIALVVVITVAIASSDKSTPRSSPDQPQQSPAGSQPPPESQLASFAVLRQGHKPSSSTSGGLPPEVEETYGIALGNARLATVVDGAPLLVAPGERGLCLIDAAEAVTNCWSTETALGGDAIVSSLCSPGRRHGSITVAGLVPNGVSRVTVKRRHFGNATVPVRHNVFAASLPGGNPLPLKATWEQQGRRETHSTGIPPNARFRKCVVHTTTTGSDRQPASDSGDH
jgi:hypothetical protein